MGNTGVDFYISAYVEVHLKDTMCDAAGWTDRITRNANFLHRPEF
jgi:hypothetical protein